MTPTTTGPGRRGRGDLGRHLRRGAGPGAGRGDDSFFDLGGDSILSMQVAARARAAGLLLRPRDVFVEQTVARLARVARVAEVVDGGSTRALGSWRPPRSCAGCAAWAARSSSSTRRWWCRRR
ncbi:phosphopantetheine attachment site family protein [Mycobacterium xenopi 4042]|uniref:Phosphopantetheine attachment site family protein n=1 Tax=Mycobacterium xenopi 4042 TaxID=1299334 RepID=X8ALX7_MYCXE|nr:phosphopantetheine attachment site family protein [Mycobacterium xenopi 4042]